MTLRNGIDYVYPRGCDSARVIQVVETTAARGSGENENDRVRMVTQYWTLDGELLAENDPEAQ